MFNSLPTEYTNQILCYYTNTSKQIQIIRITDIPNWYFEWVLFPQQRLLFEAIPHAHLEVYKKRFGVADLAATILCDFLQVQEEAETPSPLYIYLEYLERARL
ncbi:DUF1830 domain-containing protein [Coleofasciculus chthonoplastes]|uniref:DUF1830 domain-containing protein n=1 Tax=Coleofasciculus chthonoplastes TaxID=64178 RepID=UPI0032F39095